MAKVFGRLSLRKRLFLGVSLCVLVALGLHATIVHEQIVPLLQEVGVPPDTIAQVSRRVIVYSLPPTLMASLVLATLVVLVQMYPVVLLIRRLTAAAHAIASEQFHHRVLPPRWVPYDLRLFVESFNLMADQLERYALLQKRQQRELQQRNELLERLSVTDPLTQVGNHRAFQEHLHSQISLACRKNLPLCLMLIDVDHFKEYNDTYGHLQGDMVLREVARLLTENTRTYDFVARYGGEEFAMILPDTTSDIARQVAERIRQVIALHPFPHRQITVSIGVAAWRAGMDPSQLIQEADLALYRAKQGGRNRVCVAETREQAA